MKPGLVLLALALLSASDGACGGSSSTTRSTASTSYMSLEASATTPSTTPAPVETKVDGDQDNDIGASYDDKSNTSDLNFGHAASAYDKHAIAALVKRYYATALAGDGAQACAMIYSTLAERVPEAYGQVPGPLYMRGAKTCPAALALLFKHFHPQLAIEVPNLRVTRVRLMEHHGYALLSFGTLPERKILVAREGHTWRMNGLIDSELV